MRWPQLILIGLMLLGSAARAAELKLVGEAREHRFVAVASDQVGPWLVIGPNAAVLVNTTQLAGVPVLGKPAINRADSRVVDGGKGCVFVGPPGFYAVVQWVPEESEPSLLVVEISSDGPKPPGPGPEPGPNPPSPAPIPVAGFRVLIIEERQDRSQLPKSQALALDSAEVMEYLNRKCVMGPDGKTPEWRKYDDDVDLSKESAVWQQAIKLPRTSLPWIVISDGTKGISCPFPKTTPDVLALLKQYGGD
jgi:hypothetical protein